MRADFRITGASEFDAALAEFSKATQRRILDRALRNAATPIERTAERLAPFVTSRLRRSIETIIVKSSAGKGAFARAMRSGSSRAEAGAAAYAANSADGGASRVAKVRVQATAPHAHWIEFGMINQPAQPFMRPAVDAEKGRALSSIKSELRKEIEKTAKRAASRRRKAK